MPTLENLNTLEELINKLGDEPRLRAERGEVIASEPPLPREEPNVPDDSAAGGIDEMEALLGDYADEAGGEDSTDAQPDEFSPDEGLEPPENGNPDRDIPVDAPEEDAFPGPGTGEEEALPAAAEEPDELSLDSPDDFSDEDAAELESIDAESEGDSIQEFDAEPLPEPPELADTPDTLPEVEGLQEEEAGELPLEEVPEYSDDADQATELSLDEELNFQEELGTDILSDIKSVDDDSQLFSMDDFDDQYNFTEEDQTPELGIDLESLEQSLDDADEEEAPSFTMEAEDFRALQATLFDLPINLKLAIEELLADERRQPDDLRPLIDDLVNGESPRALAKRFQAITKRKIVLPRSYEKQSGHALLERREALSYRLLIQGWPILRTILFTLAALWILGMTLFMWVYRPLKAASLYKMGLDAIALDQVDEAEMLFHDAWDGWPLFASPEGGDRISDAAVVVKGWKNSSQWLEYAQSLRRRKHWNAAARFYEGYLAVKPGKKDIRLEFAAFLSQVLGQHEKATAVLDSAPPSSWRKWGREYTLASGDVFLNWAEDDVSKYEDARFHYAKALETSRNDERAVLSMMRYHQRLGNDEEITRLLPAFKNELPGETSSPVLAAEVFAGLGIHHLARGNARESRRFIDLALAADPESPEAPFVDAQFWRSQGEELRELGAYERTLVNLETREALNKNDWRIWVLALGGVGRINASQAHRLLAVDQPQADAARNRALSNYDRALKLYEEALRRGRLGSAPEYGQLYVETGDIMFQGRLSAEDLTFILVEKDEALKVDGERRLELQQAEHYYNEGERLFGRGPGGTRLPDAVLYRRAYARHLLRQDGALLDLHRVVRLRPDNPDARMALATVLLENGDYEASRSQYNRSIGLLDNQLAFVGGGFNPSERQDHQELLIRYVMAWNNLGVARALSAAGGGGDADYAAALSAFVMASEYSDQTRESMGDLPDRGLVEVRNSEGRRILKDRTTLPYRNRTLLLDSREADAYLMYSDIPSNLN